MKTIHKNLLIAASLFLLAGAGCTQPVTTSLDTDNANETVINTTPVNTNEAVVENTSVVQDNENTNTAISNTNDGDGETTDTSDWLTYTNDEYGFAVSYPRDWTIWTDYNPNTEEYSFNTTARHFTITQSSQLSKDQDFTPGINILVKTDDEINSLKTELENDNEGSFKAEVDGIEAFIFYKVDIVYEQIIIVPKKHIQVIVRVDENYEMSKSFKDIYNSIQFI